MLNALVLSFSSITSALNIFVSLVFTCRMPRSLPLAPHITRPLPSSAARRTLISAVHDSPSAVPTSHGVSPLSCCTQPLFSGPSMVRTPSASLNSSLPPALTQLFCRASPSKICAALWLTSNSEDSFSVGSATAKPVAKASPATQLHAAKRQPNTSLWFQFIVSFCYNKLVRRGSSGLFLGGQGVF